MQKRQLLLTLDEETIEALRRLALARGFICKRGPGAPVNRGSITKLLEALAQEAPEPRNH
jgi:hypothetical protein